MGNNYKGFFFMLKRFQIWKYLKLLEFRYKKEGKWVIDENYLLAISNGFNNKWLNNVDNAKLVSVDIQVYYTSLHNLSLALDEFILFISKDSNIESPTSRYSSYINSKTASDYFVDSNNKPINFISFEIELKSKISRLIVELKRSNEKSNLQYGYYKRCMEKIQSDVLEVYWILLQLTR